MAKNKNRQQAKQQRPSAERGADQAPGAGPEPSEPMHSPVATGDMAHKGRQKRFGHN
ncbi:hypothetical protein [Streptomyces sp. GC420]|uniref:hypothetical protein n=1 Tax=Streptomyces sp. GC420 TaxID=2697568 RepID=UPI001414CEA6|nr:hypothetical protein [Streptomyces sp. GC420]